MFELTPNQPKSIGSDIIVCFCGFACKISQPSKMWLWWASEAQILNLGIQDFERNAIFYSDVFKNLSYYNGDPILTDVVGKYSFG